ncbi:MAG: SET domain-containing protein, partial [Planctomycetota bacterium]
MIHPDTELRKVNETIGYGVFATRHIPKGTILYVK